MRLDREFDELRVYLPGVPGGVEVLCLGRDHAGAADAGFAPELAATAEANPPSCTTTCLDCPGYESRPHAMWAFVLALAMTSPVLLCLVAQWLDAPCTVARRPSDANSDGDGEDDSTDALVEFVPSSDASSASLSNSKGTRATAI